jgi:hypothetical protein
MNHPGGSIASGNASIVLRKQASQGMEPGMANQHHAQQNNFMQQQVGLTG